MDPWRVSSISSRHTKGNTPVSKAVTLTDLTVDTVEVIDPTHALYGKTLPLVGVTTRKNLGRVAIVRIHPGVERKIPLSATSLADTLTPPPSPCRLSVVSVERLLAMVASLPNTGSEEEHGENHPGGEATGATRAASGGPHTAEHRGEGCPPAGGMDDSETAEQGFGEGEMGRCDEGGGL